MIYTQDRRPRDGGPPTGHMSHRAPSGTAPRASAAPRKAGRCRCWAGLHPEPASWPGPSKALRVWRAFPPRRTGLPKRKSSRENWRSKECVCEEAMLISAEKQSPIPNNSADRHIYTHTNICSSGQICLVSLSDSSEGWKYFQLGFGADDLNQRHCRFFGIPEANSSLSAKFSQITFNPKAVQIEQSRVPKCLPSSSRNNWSFAKSQQETAHSHRQRWTSLGDHLGAEMPRSSSGSLPGCATSGKLLNLSGLRVSHPHIIMVLSSQGRIDQISYTHKVLEQRLPRGRTKRAELSSLVVRVGRASRSMSWVHACSVPPQAWAVRPLRMWHCSVL